MGGNNDGGGGVSDGKCGEGDEACWIERKGTEMSALRGP